MKKIAIVTTSRADFSYAYPIAKAILRQKGVSMDLIAGPAHFERAYGNTYKDILNSGLKISHRLSVRLTGDQPSNISFDLGSYIQQSSRLWNKSRPDYVVILGDRLEVLAIALSVIPFNIPLAHVGGGDFTFGAVDEQVRHALTKISHLHFVSNSNAKKVLEQMGESPSRVFDVGSLVIDSIKDIKLWPLSKIRKVIPLTGKGSFLLATLHPQTISKLSVQEQVSCFLKALESVPHPIVFTYPNMDACNKTIITSLHKFTRKHKNKSILIHNAGRELYYSLVKNATALVGNSSSLIYDTPYLLTPAVNVGERQAGRLRARNVIDVPFNSYKIEEAINRCLDPRFRESFNDEVKYFFGNGYAAKRIVSVLTKLNSRNLLGKEFQVKV